MIFLTLTNKRKMPSQMLQRYERRINHLEVKFPSDIKTGNSNIDDVSAIYKPTKKRGPVILILHGFTMQKESFLNYGDYLNQLGISSFHIDLPYHGERGEFGEGYSHREFDEREIKEGLNQALSDIEKSAKVLRRIGHKKISIAGYSLGGILTLLALGKIGEFRKGIAICAGGDLTDLILNSPIAQTIARGLRKRGINYNSLKDYLEDFEPNNYTENINPDDLLMVNGRYDNIVPPKNTQAFIDAMKAKPNVYWQDCDHFSPQFEELSIKHLRGFR